MLKGQALRQYLYPSIAGSRRVAGLELPASSCSYTINPGHYSREGARSCLQIIWKGSGFGSADCMLSIRFWFMPISAPTACGLCPLSRQLGLPLIVTFHGSDATALNPRRGEVPHSDTVAIWLTETRLRRGASLFLAVSDFIRGKLLEQNVAPEKLIVHYIGVDTRFFSPAGVEAEPIVLFVGRLSERKGPSYLIQAMARSAKRISSGRVGVDRRWPIA